jgi:Helix-turn-helix
MRKEYRPIPADEVLSRFPPERQAKINARAIQLIAQEVGLSDLRKAQHLTQEEVAARLGGKQVHISRFEKRSDVKLSKLCEYVEAIGGTLDLLVTLPDGVPYKLARPPASPRRGGSKKTSKAKRANF